MKWFIGALGIATFVLFAAMATAQDPATTLTCTPDDMTQMATVLDEQYKVAQDAAAAGDVAGWIEGLQNFRYMTAMLDGECRGKSFSSEVDGQQPVLGPIAFQDGIWRATFTTPEFGQVQFTPVSGDCDQFKTMLLFNGGFGGEFASGGQAVFTAKTGCTALISVGLATDPWTLTFELVSTP